MECPALCSRYNPIELGWCWYHMSLIVYEKAQNDRACSSLKFMVIHTRTHSPAHTYIWIRKEGWSVASLPFMPICYKQEFLCKNGRACTLEHVFLYRLSAWEQVRLWWHRPPDMGQVKIIQAWVPGPVNLERFSRRNVGNPSFMSYRFVGNLLTCSRDSDGYD